MPRIGSGFAPPQIDPQTGETIGAPSQANASIPQQPPAVIPAQQPAPALPPQLQPPSEQGLGNHLVAGLANLTGGGGIIPSLIGGIGGLITGHRIDPAAQQQRALQAQYNAYIAAGIPHDRAVLATINPEAAKVILPQALGAKHLQSLGNGYVADDQGHVSRAYEPEDKFAMVKTGQDGLGRETYGVQNKSTGEIKPYTPPGSSSDNSGGLGDMSLTGKEYLASMPKGEANIVQQMAEGTLPPPSSFALAKPAWVNRIAAAKNYDPTFDAANWGGRVAGVKDFSAGKSSEMVRSANQTIGHVGDLIGKMDELHNGDYPLKNKVGNYISSNTGGAAVTGFQQTAHAVADELSKVFKGAGISDHEIRQWEENLSPNMSPAQQHEAVTTAMSLLQHSLSALEEKRLNSIGPMAAEKAGPLLKPDAQATVARIKKWAAGKADEAAAAPATTKTGVEWSVVQ